MSMKLDLLFTWSLALVTFMLMAPLSTPLAVIYVIFLFLATFVSPAWLIHIQQYKKYAG